MKLYLIRHGETDWNKMRRIQGSANVDLNEYGRELARITRDALKGIPFDAAYTSPLNRAKETGEIILGRRNLKLFEDSRLAEMHFGTYEGAKEADLRKNGDDFLNAFDCPEQFHGKGGSEKHQDVIERAQDFMKDVILPGEGQYEHFAVFSHGALIHAMLTSIYQRQIKDFWHPPGQLNCGVSTIEVHHGICRVLDESRIFY